MFEKKRHDLLWISSDCFCLPCENTKITEESLVHARNNVQYSCIIQRQSHDMSKRGSKGALRELSGVSREHQGNTTKQREADKEQKHEVSLSAEAMRLYRILEI